MTFGPKMHDAPSKVLLTVIQRDGTFKAVEKLREIAANALTPAQIERPHAAEASGVIADRHPRLPDAGCF